MKKNKKGVICFDLDETLIHSSRAHVMAYQQALKKHGFIGLTQEKLLSKFGVSSKIYLKQLIPEISKKDIESVRNLHAKLLIKTSKKYVSTIRGVRKSLKILSKDYILAIVTNCTSENIKILLKAARLDSSLFEVVVGNDKGIKPKPSPEEIVKAGHLLKHKADYMVGDTIYDIIAARKARVKGIAVLTGMHTRSMLKKEKPYKILKSVKDLPAFLNKKN